MTTDFPEFNRNRAPAKDAFAETKKRHAKTDHAAAVAYAAKGWCGFKTRDDWEDSLRFKGVMKL